MEHTETNNLVQQLATGFGALQDEYQKLFGQHQSLERKLATAREQVRHVLFYFQCSQARCRWYILDDETTFSSRSVAVRL